MEQKSMSKKVYISWEGYDSYIDSITNWVKTSDLNLGAVYGLPRGGLPIAVSLSHRLHLPLLMDYYDVLDNEEDFFYHDNPELSQVKKNINSEKEEELSALDILNMKNKKNRKQKKVTRKRKKKNVDNQSKDIMEFFGCKEENKETIDDNDDTKIKDRSKLLNQYRMLVDNEYISEKNKNYNPIKRCLDCDVDKTLIQSEGLYVCMECGEGEMVIIESERPNYKDVVPEKPGYPYKRIKIGSEKYPTIYIQSSVCRKMVESLMF